VSFLIVRQIKESTFTAGSMETFKDGNQTDASPKDSIYRWQLNELVRLTTVCKSVAEAADREYSYVVVATKVIPELTKTPELLAPLLSASYNAKFRQPTYVLIQNGLNVEVDLFNALAQLQIQGVLKEVPCIIGGALWIATNLREPNVVDHSDWVSAYCRA
jgi:hypothetical protein